MRNSKCTPVAVLSLLLILASTGCSRLNVQSAALSGEVLDWENPEVIGRNKEPGHCTLAPYPDARMALKAEREDSPYYRSLNGKWKFNWVRKPADRPVDFYRPDYDVSRWKEIPVPSNWQLHG